MLSLSRKYATVEFAWPGDKSLLISACMGKNYEQIHRSANATTIGARGCKNKQDSGRRYL